MYVRMYVCMQVCNYIKTVQNHCPQLYNQVFALPSVINWSVSGHIPSWGSPNLSKVGEENVAFKVDHTTVRICKMTGPKTGEEE